MKSKANKKFLSWVMIAFMLVTLFPSTAFASGMTKPTGLRLGIGEAEKTFEDGSTATVRYSCGATLLGLHFDEVQEIEDNDDLYRWDLEMNTILPDGTTFPETGGGCAVYPFVHLFNWITVDGKSPATRDVDSITIAFEDDNGNKSDRVTLDTDITVTQVESSEAVTVCYLGTEHPSWSTDPEDKEATFTMSGLPSNHSIFFGNPEKNGTIGETESNGTLKIKDYYSNGDWSFGIGDLDVGADEIYYLDVYKTTVVDDKTATLEITRHPVNFIFSGFDITVGGALIYNNGNQITPVITVKTTDASATTLVEGVDFELSFEKNGTSIADSEVKNAGVYTAVITGKTGTDYEGKVATKSFTVAKATPNAPAVAAGLSAVFGQTLAEIVLPSDFTWQDSSETLVGNVGTNVFKAQYNPDPDNYNSVTGIDVTVTVLKANQTKPVLSLSSETGILGLNAPVLTLTGGNGNGTAHYESSNPDVAAVDSATGAITVLAVGTTTFTVTKAGDSNYNDSELSDEVLLIVKNKAELTVKDTAATDAAIVSVLKNQGQINVGTPVRTGLSNNFTVAVNGKNALNTYTSSNASQGDAKWIGLLIGNLKINEGTAYTVTDLYYKTTESGTYAQLTETDKTESSQVGGTDKELVLWIKSDVDTTKNIWLATSYAGDNETKMTVNFTPYKSSSHSGGGSGGSSTGTTESAAGESKTKTDQTSTVSASISAATDTKGMASITVPAKTITDLIEKAKTAEDQANRTVIAIDVKTDVSAKAAEVIIEKGLFKEITKETKAEVEIKTGLGSITFDEKALDAIGSKADSDISIRMETVDGSGLSEEIKAVVGTRPVYDMTVLSGDEKISSFEGGTANISIPYELRTGEDKNAVVVYYIDDSGTLQAVRGAYNEKTGTVDFAVSHFSQYAVGYNKVSYADASSSAWYADAVTFLSARGVANGTSETTFSPNKSITRGEFLVMLMRAYGIQPEEKSNENFADAGNAYYTPYLAAAKSMGITEGTGNNLYQPNSQISRQDMMTMLYRALDELEEVPEKDSDVTVQFSDSDQVAAYAKTSVAELAAAGIVAGNNGKVEPTGTTTRAQMAQILFNLLSE